MSQPISRFGELNSMMSWAENAAKAKVITRENADRWAFHSHQCACEAIRTGKFKDEIVPIVIPQKKGQSLVIDTDEPHRSDSSLEKLSKLPTVYPNGVCTAGNSSTENDGAAAVLLMRESSAMEQALQSLGLIRSFAVAATDPTLTYPAVPIWDLFGSSHSCNGYHANGHSVK